MCYKNAPNSSNIPDIYKLNGTKAYEAAFTDEKTVVNSRSNELPNKFAVNVRRPTIYWLPKLHKRLYKANFSSCTTIERSKLLTSCLTAVIRY